MERDTFLAVLSRRLRSGGPAPIGAELRALATPASPAEALVGDALLDLFVSRAAEVGAVVERVPSRAAAFDAVASVLDEEAHDAIAGPPSLRFPAAEGRWTLDARAAGFGLSEAEWGIAETGGVVLRHEGAMGRAYSLVPPSVGVLLPASRLLPSLAVVLARLDGTAPPACITVMSGVSHSADIAGVSCTGVHGPVSVRIWLLDDE